MLLPNKSPVHFANMTVVKIGMPHSASPVVSMSMTAKEMVIRAMPESMAVAPMSAYTPGLPPMTPDSWTAWPKILPNAAPPSSAGTKRPLGTPSPYVSTVFAKWESAKMNSMLLSRWSSLWKSQLMASPPRSTNSRCPTLNFSMFVVLLFTSGMKKLKDTIANVTRITSASRTCPRGPTCAMRHLDKCVFSQLKKAPAKPPQTPMSEKMGSSQIL
mmetsp:Transcript_128061/g.370631  ORF Transcript_128061/g.370631 Transcript_128061/m.370631 type:complete len:215 (-) Transcript_128061:973-1617(-)